MEHLKIRSSQKIFTEEEVSGLTGVCLEHLRAVSRSRHLGSLVRAAEAAAEAAADAAGAAAEAAVQAAGEQADRWLYTDSDLIVVAVLHPRCDH